MKKKGNLRRDPSNLKRSEQLREQLNMKVWQAGKDFVQDLFDAIVGYVEDNKKDTYEKIRLTDVVNYIVIRKMVMVEAGGEPSEELYAEQIKEMDLKRLDSNLTYLEGNRFDAMLSLTFPGSVIEFLEDMRWEVARARKNAGLPKNEVGQLPSNVVQKILIDTIVELGDIEEREKGSLNPGLTNFAIDLYENFNYDKLKENKQQKSVIMV